MLLRMHAAVHPAVQRQHICTCRATRVSRCQSGMFIFPAERQHPRLPGARLCWRGTAPAVPADSPAGRVARWAVWEGEGRGSW